MPIEAMIEHRQPGHTEKLRRDGRIASLNQAAAALKDREDERDGWRVTDQTDFADLCLTPHSSGCRLDAALTPQYSLMPWSTRRSPITKIVTCGHRLRDTVTTASHAGHEVLREAVHGSLTKIIASASRMRSPMTSGAVLPTSDRRRR
jgi:hypothetical protein